MTKQPTALRLADELDHLRGDAAAELRRLHGLVEHLQLTVFGFETKLATRGYEIQIDDLKGEVRRLHEANQELLEALRSLVSATEGVSINDYNEEAHDIAVNKARAALAKVGGQHE